MVGAICVLSGKGVAGSPGDGPYVVIEIAVQNGRIEKTWVSVGVCFTFCLPGLELKSVSTTAQLDQPFKSTRRSKTAAFPAPRLGFTRKDIFVASYDWVLIVGTRAVFCRSGRLQRNGNTR